MTHAAALIGWPEDDRAATVSDEADLVPRTTWLLCRAGTQLCALPLEHVVEIMRGLPAEPVAGAAPYVRGLSVIRGAPVPVIDAGLLVGQYATENAQLVTIRVEGRTIALAVQSVLGLSTLASDVAREMPPLLRDAANESVEAIGIRDAELLFFLRTARIVPDDLLRGLAAVGAAS